MSARLPSEVWEAMTIGDMVAVRGWVDANQDPLWASGLDDRYVHWATEDNRVDLLELLVGAGARLDVKYREGNLLHLAAESNAAAAASFLVERGVDASAADSDQGGTPLHAAARKGAVAAARVLIAAGAGVSTLDRNEASPLWFAVYSTAPKVEMIDLLIENGADLGAPGWQGCGGTLLHIAARSCQPEHCRKMLETGFFDVDGIEWKTGNTPLHYACRWETVRSVAMLLEAGADPERRNLEGKRPEDMTEDTEVKAVFAAWRGRKAAGEALAALGMDHAPVPGGCHGKVG